MCSALQFFRCSGPAPRYLGSDPGCPIGFEARAGECEMAGPRRCRRPAVFDSRPEDLKKKSMETHKDVEAHLGMVNAFLGMDPRSDLYGMTFFGNEIGKHTGTLIVHAKTDQKRLMGMAQAVPGQSTRKHGDYDVFSFVHKHHHHSQTVAGTFLKSDRLVVSSSVEELQAALGVLEGKSQSLQDGAPLAGNVPSGTTVLFRIAGVAVADLPCKCAVAKKIDSFRFVMGEHNGQSFFRSRTVTTDAEVTNPLKAVVEWGRAMALANRVVHRDALYPSVGLP